MFNLNRVGFGIMLIAAGLIASVSGCLNNNYSLSISEQKLHQDSLKVRDPNRWSKEIGNFLQSDQNTPPPQNAILFIGSSSIVGWNTQKWFSDIETINRGFGGSYMSDSAYYADKIAIPYKPKTVVIYAGDNDTVDNKAPEMIFADFKAFVVKVRNALPNTRIIAVSIKPSIDRWRYWPKMQQTNKLICDYCQKQPNMYFIDMSKVMLDESGLPRKDMFKSDGLHLNEIGYEQWTAQIRPLIDKK